MRILKLILALVFVIGCITIINSIVGNKYNWNQIVELSIVHEGVEYSANSVQNIVLKRVFDLGSGGNINFQPIVYGEMPVIQLNDGRYIFCLLNKNVNKYVGSWLLPNGYSSGEFTLLDLVEINNSGKDFPILITFSDINDPYSVTEFIDYENAKILIAPSKKEKTISNIREILPWFNDLKEMSSPEFSMADGRVNELEYANLLGSGNEAVK